MPNLTLRDSWLKALRASTAFATGRECDYAMSEHDADRFNPIGLLALAAGDNDVAALTPSETGWRYAHTADGAWYSRFAAATLAQEVGLDPELLPELCELSDDGWSGMDIASWVERNVSRE